VTQADLNAAGVTLTSNMVLRFTANDAAPQSIVEAGLDGPFRQVLDRAAELAPDNPRFAYVLGIALNSMGQPAEAVRVLGDARTRFDGDFDIAMALATILRDSGDSDGALEIAYSLARRHPESQDVVALLRSLQAIP